MTYDASLPHVKTAEEPCMPVLVTLRNLKDERTTLRMPGNTTVRQVLMNEKNTNERLSSRIVTG